MKFPNSKEEMAAYMAESLATSEKRMWSRAAHLLAVGMEVGSIPQLTFGTKEHLDATLAIYTALLNAQD